MTVEELQLDAVNGMGRDRKRDFPGAIVWGGGCAEKRHSTQLFKLHGTQLVWFGLGFRILRSVWFF